MKTLTQIEPLLMKLGSNVSDASNWIARLDDFSARLKKTIGGTPRRFTRENAIELLLIAATVKAGAAPLVAASYAKSAMTRFKSTGKPSGEWLVFRCGNFTSSTDANDPDMRALTKKSGRVPLSLVPFGEIIRMVDDLFNRDNV